MLLAAALIAVAALVAVLIQRRQPSPEAAPSFTVPERIDRGELPGPDRPWLLAVFSAHTCSTCATVVGELAPLAGPDVAFAEIELDAARALHERYAIGAVPLLLIVDVHGSVRHHVFGPVTRQEVETVLDALRQEG
ncbi:TlpA family protein disulfide reductase [Rhabdothermincola sp.]|uniref:TlpA family protein disulfide reductase n=1 Tax=Rhabdothermincola sp. TaxID=2820405 RepID=UPI002FE1C128